MCIILVLAMRMIAFEQCSMNVTHFFSLQYIESLRFILSADSWICNSEAPHSEITSCVHLKFKVPEYGRTNPVKLVYEYARRSLNVHSCFLFNWQTSFYYILGYLVAVVVSVCHILFLIFIPCDSFTFHSRRIVSCIITKLAI